MSENKVTIEVHQDRCDAPGGYTVLLMETDDKGTGSGYRLAGGKVCALGKDRHHLTAELDQRDAREIFGHIRTLAGDEWIRGQLDA